MTELIIVCEDLFGLEVLSLIEHINQKSNEKGRGAVYKIKGYISDVDNPFGKLSCSIERLGTISGNYAFDNEKCVMAICNPQSKQRAVETLKVRGAEFQTIVTPWTNAPLLQIGEGSIISAYTIKDGIKIGKFVTIIGSMLSNHVIGDYSTVLRFANVAGDEVGKGTYIGNHVFVAVGKNVGDDCYVADGSIVVKNVKSGTSVSGIPAKKMKQ